MDNNAMNNNNTNIPEEIKGTSSEANRFHLNGALGLRKMLSYLPVMIMSNISTLLLISIDGLVVGNLVGGDALASVNIFYPVTQVIGAVTAVVASGASTCLSTSFGSEDHNDIQHLKSSINVTAIVTAIILSVVQIPFIYGMIESYHLDPGMKMMTLQYATGVMIATPFGLFSTLGVYQLQIVGKMKYLMYLSAMEGIVNTVLDVLFVGPLGLGVAGAGFGTAGANIVRCTVTVIVLWKTTDIYKTGGKKPRWKDVKEIITTGIPEGANSLMIAFQSYCIMQILLASFGNTGGAIKGVTAFCFSLANVLITGVQGSMRPMTGLLSGAGFHGGLRILMRQGMVLITVFMTAMTAVFWLFPDAFYNIHGVKDIPDGGILSLRLYSLFLVAKGMDTIFRLYFANRKDKTFATWLTVLGNATLPVFAFILSRLFPAPFVFLSYLCTESIIFTLNIWRYRWWKKEDDRKKDESERVFYMSVDPDEAVEASRWIQKTADDAGYSARITNRVALCMEELVGSTASAKETNDVRKAVRKRIRKSHNKHQKNVARLELKRNEFNRTVSQDISDAVRKDLGDKAAEDLKNKAEKLQKVKNDLKRLRELREKKIEEEDVDFEFNRDMEEFERDYYDQLDETVKSQIVVRITKDEGIFVMINDGGAMVLEESSDIWDIMNSSISFIKKISKSVEYKYILDMNYIVVKV